MDTSTNNTIPKQFKFYTNLLKGLGHKARIIMILSLIFCIIPIGIQVAIIVFYSNSLPSSIIMLSILSILTYFVISFISILKRAKLEFVQQELEQSKQYSKTLEILYDTMKAFKHDFNNIIQTMGGYVQTEDIKGFSTYYHHLYSDCKKINNLTALNPAVINNPAVYSLLTNKYYKAEDLGIKIQVEFFLDLNTLNMNIYEFSRILGILLDNAIEASSNCDEKIINITFCNAPKLKKQYVLIENTYKEKDIDIDRIFEKSFSSKPTNTGLGLWNVRNILKQHNNLNLYTTKDEQFFKQQLEIFF